MVEISDPGKKSPAETAENGGKQWAVVGETHNGKAWRGNYKYTKQITNMRWTLTTALMNGDESGHSRISETRNGTTLEVFTRTIWGTCHVTQVHKCGLKLSTMTNLHVQRWIHAIIPTQRVTPPSHTKYENMSYASKIGESALIIDKPSTIQLTICIHTPHHQKQHEGKRPSARQIPPF